MTWDSDWKKISDKVDRVLSEATRATLFEVSTAIIKETPAKTGRARGNWQASVGRGASGEVEGIKSKRHGQAVAISSVDQSVSVAVGGVYFLTNNLPYIERLEYGWSQQAPSGMVRTNMQQFNRLFVKNLRAAGRK